MPKADDQPATGMAMPVMRGFACPVETPFMGAGTGPEEGIGCGWANVAEQGPQFFITMHAKGGFAMSAKLDYARYRRFAENYAAMGRQAMLTGRLDEQGPNDPLHALGVAHKALSEMIQQRENETRPGGSSGVRLEHRRALKTVAEALFLPTETKDETP
jgi:hypothetical protein